MSLNGLKLFCATTLLTLLVGCANFSSGKKHSESSDNQKFGRAPSAIGVPASMDEKSEPIDPLHMRMQADYYFAKGEALSYEGKSKEAADAFKMVMIYDPESVEVPLRLASEYLKSGQTTLALETVQGSLAKNPKSTESYLLLGGIYSNMKMYDKAQVAYEKVLQLDPKGTEAPLYLGAVYAEQKMYDKAIVQFQKLANNDKYESPHLAWYYIGRIRAEQPGTKSHKLAEDAFRKSLTYKPSYGESVLALASLYMKEDHFDQALSLLKTFQYEHGPNLRIAEILSQMYLEKENYEDAYAQLEILEQATDDILGVKLRMALILIEKKNYNAAINKLSDIIRVAPDSDKIRFYLAAVYQEVGQREKALEHFAKVPSESQFFVEATIYSVHMYKQMNESGKALKIIKNAVEQRNESAQLHGIYASVLDDNGQTKEAYEHLENTLKLFPKSTQIHFYMGTLVDKLGDKDRVIDHMKTVLVLNPKHAQALNYLAFTYAELGTHLDDAEKLSKQAVQLEPKDALILDTYGWVMLKKGRTGEAIRILETAQRTMPQESVIAEHLAEAYYKNKMNDRARKYYEIAAEREPDEKKSQEIREKITSMDKQEIYKTQPPTLLDDGTSSKRSPASVPAPINLIPGK